MGFVPYNDRVGVTYGIKIVEGWMSKIIRNFPLLNLLYTKKVRIGALRKTYEGRPIDGVFKYVRLPRWWMKALSLEVAFLVDSHRTLVYGDDAKNSRIFELALTDPCFIARDWRTITVIRCDV